MSDVGDYCPEQTFSWHRQPGDMIGECWLPPELFDALVGGYTIDGNVSRYGSFKDAMADLRQAREKLATAKRKDGPLCPECKGEREYYRGENCELVQCPKCKGSGKFSGR